MNRRSFFALTSASFFTFALRRNALASPPRIALHVESDGTASQAILDRLLIALTAHLLRTGKFQVVDRARLSAVIKEQGFSNSAYADPKTAAALGKLAGASRILNATVGLEVVENTGAYLSSQSIQVTASFTVVGVDSGQILSAGSAQGDGQRQAPAGSSTTVSQSQLEREAIDACCDDLIQQMDGAG